MSVVTLTASMRSNLLSLQSTQDLMNTTQTRLASGLKVNSPLDNPASYFAASAMRLRASDLGDLKDSMGNAIQAIKTATTAVQGIEALLKTAKGVIESARTASAADRGTLAVQYAEVLRQINQLAKDSDFQGINLVGSTGSAVTLDVTFDQRSGHSASKLTLIGFSTFTSGLGTSGVTSGVGSVGGSFEWSANSGANLGLALNSQASQLSRAISYLEAKSAGMAANLAIITARLDYSTNLSNVLNEGADKLTLADANQEGANMLALQTRQQLGVTSLSLASQANQSILRLFG